MAYADSNEISKGRLTSIIMVVALHVFLGYALVTGLAHEAIEQVAKTITAVEVDEEEPPEEEEPPPPEEIEIVPPPEFTPKLELLPPPPPDQRQTETDEPDNTQLTEEASNEKVDEYKSCPGGGNVLASQACPEPKKTCWDGSEIPRSSTCPPEKKSSRPNPEPRGNPGRWATANDYPTRALRDEREGTTRFRVVVNARGRVENCSVTGSSGHADLDAATCKNIKRRARFRPALDKNDNPISGTYSNRVRWQIPK